MYTHSYSHSTKCLRFQLQEKEKAHRKYLLGKTQLLQINLAHLIPSRFNALSIILARFLCSTNCTMNVGILCCLVRYLAN